MSLSAAATMALLLLFGTGFIEYLPVPILTAIVITALLGACHFPLGQRLFKKKVEMSSISLWQHVVEYLSLGLFMVL